MRNYHLAEHARACITPTGAIFLNLERDVYTGLDAVQASALVAAVEGWPESSPAPAELHEEDLRALIASLCNDGVLCPRRKPGRSYRPAAHNEPTDELMAWRYMTRPKVRVRDVLSFMRALATATLMLRCRRLSAVARRAQRLAMRNATPPDIARTRELLTLYTYIRMFVFARHDRCLLDSLVLLEFLAQHGVRAQWIIGVRLRPFAAHSWLQQQHFVLNGTPEYVRSFRTIFTT